MAQIPLVTKAELEAAVASGLVGPMGPQGPQGPPGTPVPNVLLAPVAAVGALPSSPSGNPICLVLSDMSLRAWNGSAWVQVTGTSGSGGGGGGGVDGFPNSNIVVIDNCNRSDASPPGSPWATTDIVGSTNYLSIITNRLGASGSGNSGYIAGPYGPNFDVTVDVPVAPASGYSAFFLRTQEAGGGTVVGYVLTITPTSGASTWKFYKSGGASTPFAEITDGPALAANESWGIRLDGNTATAYHRPDGGDWELVITATVDGTYSTEGAFGMEVADTTVRFDNLSIGNATGSTPGGGGGGGTSGGVLSTVQQIQAAALTPGTYTVADGVYSTINLSNCRPSGEVVFVANSQNVRYDGGIIFNRTANITFNGGITRTLDIQPATSTTYNDTLTFKNMQIGGTSFSDRRPIFACVAVREYSRNLTFEDCTVGYTQGDVANFPPESGDSGFGFRLTVGSEPFGSIDAVTIRRTKVIACACDTFQISGVSNWLAELVEVSYCGDIPAQGTNYHSDYVQDLGGHEGTWKNCYFHDIGYFQPSATPADGVGAGNWIVHGWNTHVVTLDNCLFLHGRNYAIQFKEEDNGATADNYYFKNCTFLTHGPPQPTVDNAILHRGDHTYENTILGKLAVGTGTVTAVGTNLLRSGSQAGFTTDASLEFNSDGECVDHPGVGYTKPDGAWWTIGNQYYDTEAYLGVAPSDDVWPTTSIVDTTVRSDQAPPGSPWAASGSVGPTNYVGIVSNAIGVPSGDSAPRTGYISADYGPNLEYYCEVSALPSDGGYVALYFLMQDAGTGGFSCYFLVVSRLGSTYNWQFKKTGSVAYGSPVAQPLVVGSRIGLKLVGSEATAYYQADPDAPGTAVAVTTATVSGISAAGKVGIEVGDTAGRYTNFGAGTI